MFPSSYHNHKIIDVKTMLIGRSNLRIIHHTDDIYVYPKRKVNIFINRLEMCITENRIRENIVISN